MLTGVADIMQFIIMLQIKTKMVKERSFKFLADLSWMYWFHSVTSLVNSINTVMKQVFCFSFTGKQHFLAYWLSQTFDKTSAVKWENNTCQR